MVTPQVVNELEMYLGASFIYHFQWWDYERNAPQPLVNCRIDMAFRPAVNFEIAFLRISTEDFIFIEDACEGKFTVHIPAAVTDVIDYRLYRRAYFDCLVTKGDFTYNIMTGKLNLYQLSTRPDAITRIDQIPDCKPEEDKYTPPAIPDCKPPIYAHGINLPHVRINGKDIGCRNCSSEYIEQLIKEGILDRSTLDKLAYVNN